MIIIVHGIVEQSALAAITEDRRLCEAELGLLLYLLTRQHGSAISARLVGQRFKCGPGRVRRLWETLKTLGYAKYEPHTRPPRLVVSLTPSRPKGG